MSIKFKLLAALLLFIGFTLAEKYYHFDGSKQSSNCTADVASNNATEPESSTEEKNIEIGQKIKRKTYYNYETEDGNSITFSAWGKTNHGACTFSEGSILKDNVCRFTYSYIIQNGQIYAKFSDSDCEGRSTNDRTFYYDESRDIISTVVNGQTFEFAPDGSPHLKRGRRNMESLSTTKYSESDSYESESGYTTGSNGRIYENAACSLCGGTGIEKNHSSMSNEYGRVCPQCDGKGHQGY
ncbi:hypothetical protein DVK85_06145 [Flavobacterium arcticum]|uniref:Uncharacterized protein n=1 Tax=Flavobacterium arcticum TaxID=1784713 RepID=A0A345HB80_9FLAO|nr:hypothetical protein [Flavobacterium arcticum]AXG73840.1 hypothetical protein DVK85_06145 [Flavobacterium arcticum]KAF2511793.1 hypothetical protein E0W72_05665 [Flavobacterium arcticum]